MATYGPNDPDAFFDSAMADLNGHGQNFDMEEDEQFSDAVEHQTQYDTNMEDSKTQLPDSRVPSGAYNEVHNGVHNGVSNEAYAPYSTFVPTLPQLPDGKVPIGPYGVYKGVYDDSVNDFFDSPTTVAPNAPILKQTNNVQKAKPNEMRFTMPSRPEHYNPLTEPEDTIKVNKSSASEKHAAAYHNIFKKPCDTSQASQAFQASQDQHTSGCSSSRGASTPPATPPPEQQQQPAPKSSAETNPETKTELQLSSRPWNGPDDLRDVAKPFLKEKRWHDKVAHLHPSIPLASHRYWIGVLNLGQDPRTATKETHFTWMKGNRLTTVETVRNVYAATTMMEGAFMMGGERPEDKNRMEELDLFNDKVVLFKIAEEGTPASVGRLITEGLVTKETEVIELD